MATSAVFKMPLVLFVMIRVSVPIFGHRVFMNYFGCCKPLIILFLKNGVWRDLIFNRTATCRD